MTAPTMTLAQLRRERNQALEETRVCLHRMKERLEGVDDDLLDFAKNHPMLAIGGAVAVGLGAGMLVPGRPVQHLTKGSALFILGPLVGDMVQRIVRMASGEADDLPVAPAEAPLPVVERPVPGG